MIALWWLWNWKSNEIRSRKSTYLRTCYKCTWTNEVHIREGSKFQIITVDCGFHERKHMAIPVVALIQSHSQKRFLRNFLKKLTSVLYIYIVLSASRLRTLPLKVEKSSSIGLNIGEYGGRNEKVCDSFKSTSLARLWTGALSKMKVAPPFTISLHFFRKELNWTCVILAWSS